MQQQLNHQWRVSPSLTCVVCAVRPRAPTGSFRAVRARIFNRVHNHGSMRRRSISVTRANAQGKRSKRILRSAAASSLNWPGSGWRRPPMSKRPRVSGLHLLACLVLRRDCGVVFCASSQSIAARIHSRAMSNSLSRSSGLLACLASLTQSRANSSNSDPDDMTHLRQGPNFV